jgi:hypothetical protein
MMPDFRGERQDEGKECAQTELNQVNSPVAVWLYQQKRRDATFRDSFTQATIARDLHSARFRFGISLALATNPSEPAHAVCALLDSFAAGFAGRCTSSSP